MGKYCGHLLEFSGSSTFICHWGPTTFKDLEWSSVLGVKLSSFSKSDDAFLSLQALSDLYYLFGGFMDYLWSRELKQSPTSAQRQKFYQCLGSREVALKWEGPVILCHVEEKSTTTQIAFQFEKGIIQRLLYCAYEVDFCKSIMKVECTDHSLSHSPSFTPEEGLNEGNTVNLDMKDYGENERDDNSFVNLEDGKDNSESVNKNSESKRSGHSKYSVLPQTGGSILILIEEVVKVGKTMGYDMDGCIKDITEIIESQGEF
ncbi:hypothetical protein Tco_1005597 [Tanacetum coccineum]|uniref:Uncharacterized protein n=1 Tax=Tanacetum coccineum TaxID=301880 RepID=A0ABQ5FG79_9ASTR